MITYSIYTDVGSREKNEDSVCEFHSGTRKVFAVADGLGGHGMGEVASSMAIDVVKKIAENSELEKTEYLSAVFEIAQDEILDKQGNGFSNGIKTTLVVIDFSGQCVSWGHIGDSRLYYFYNNKLVNHTLDHSVPQMLVLAHKIKEKDIRKHEDRNKLLRVLGSPWGSKKYECSDVIEQKSGQSFLLCTDGFWEHIDEKTMRKLLKKANSVQDWMDSMVKVVKENGRDEAMDNNSAIAIWIR